MKRRVTLLALLLLAAGCASPVPVRVEWAEPGESPQAREVEFETHSVVRSSEAWYVSLRHEEGWWPWPFVQHNRGEDLSFSFPGPSAERTAAVSEASYQIHGQMPLHATYREGEVRPAPEDPELLGRFRVVFDVTIAGGPQRAVVTLSGPLPR